MNRTFELGIKTNKTCNIRSSTVEQCYRVVSNVHKCSDTLLLLYNPNITLALVSRVMNGVESSVRVTSERHVPRWPLYLLSLARWLSVRRLKPLRALALPTLRLAPQRWLCLSALTSLHIMTSRAALCSQWIILYTLYRQRDWQTRPLECISSTLGASGRNNKPSPLVN